MADLHAAYAVITAQALPELRDSAVRAGMLPSTYRLPPRNRCCICCSPICKPRDSADSRHSLASNSWLSGKGRCCLRLCVQLCISSLLFFACLSRSERISARRSCRFSERIHSFTSTPSGSCGHGAGRSSGCSVPLLSVSCTRGQLLPRVQGAAGPP